MWNWQHILKETTNKKTVIKVGYRYYLLMGNYFVIDQWSFITCILIIIMLIVLERIIRNKPRIWIRFPSPNESSSLSFFCVCIRTKKINYLPQMFGLTW
jgi:hypothetical protein